MITNIQELYKFALARYYNHFREDLAEFYNGRWPVREVFDTWGETGPIRPPSMDFVRRHHSKYRELLLKLDSLFSQNTHYANMYSQFSRSILIYSFGKVAEYNAVLSGSEAQDYTLWSPIETEQAAELLIDYIEDRKADFNDSVLHLELSPTEEPVDIAEYMQISPRPYVLFNRIEHKTGRFSLTFSRKPGQSFGYPILGSNDPYMAGILRDALYSRLLSCEVVSK